MAKRRKVGNLLALAVLAVALERPMHPYEMASVLRERGKDQSIKINWGSLYTVVQNLEKHGFIEAAGTTRQGRRPERTVYEITDAGRRSCVDWLRELIAVPEREYPRFEAALSVLGVLPPGRGDRAAGAAARPARGGDRRGRRDAGRRSSQRVPRLFLVEAEYRWRCARPRRLGPRPAQRARPTARMPDLRRSGGAYHETGEIPRI